MELLKELFNTSAEKATRVKIIDMILANAKQVDKSHLKDKTFAELILKAVRKDDREGITKGLSDEALLNLIKLNAEPTLEAVKLFLPHPYGNGFDKHHLEAGDMFPWDNGDGDIVDAEFVSVSDDGKKVTIKVNGKEKQITVSSLGGKIVTENGVYDWRKHASGKRMQNIEDHLDNGHRLAVGLARYDELDHLAVKSLIKNIGEALDDLHIVQRSIEKLNEDTLTEENAVHKLARAIVNSPEVIHLPKRDPDAVVNTGLKAGVFNDKLKVWYEGGKTIVEPTGERYSAEPFRLNGKISSHDLKAAYLVAIKIGSGDDDDIGFGESFELTEADDDVEDNTPKEIGKAGTWKVLFFPADESVQVVDANKKVHLEMPFVLWKQLIRQ